MSERIFLVHGWSVSDTRTYQALHLKLAEKDFEIENVYLGRYVSLDDRVEVKDLADAMQRALTKSLGKPPWNKPFHIITHSTGALITKEWILNHYIENYSANRPLGNVIFLAGPHFGSRLAHHGRSMIAHIKFLGDTGNKILTALELGSQFSWENNGSWLKEDVWRKKSIRPYCLIGDKVSGSFFAKKIFSAGFEAGSDMVVRVPAANLNFQRFRLDALTNKITKLGRVRGVPFVVLDQYTHSGAKLGIMNSIKKNADPELPKFEHLNLILQCLRVKTDTAYQKVLKQFSQITARNRGRKSKRKYISRPFAQIDFRFVDHTAAPIEDYSFTLGYYHAGREHPSEIVKHIHKNKVTPHHLTAFLDMRKFAPELRYFMKFDSSSGTNLFSYVPDPYKIDIEGKSLVDIICEDQATQIEIALGRTSSEKLFIFHPGTDKDLHLSWNRQGDIGDRKLPIK